MPDLSQNAKSEDESGSPKLLIIDDDDLVLIVLRKLLEAENCVVEALTSPRVALAKIAETHYDAILCDMWTGDMTGMEFYQELRKDFPEYQRRVIFVTGDLVSEVSWEFIEERHLPYLLKPFSRSELHRKLQEMFGERLTSGAVDSKKSPWDGAERRRARRIQASMKVRIRRKKWEVGEPEIATTVNASRSGILIISDRQYRVGTELWVISPYNGWESDIEQAGFVTRVEELPEGKWHVGIALGDAAGAARLKFECSGEDTRRHHIVIATAEQASMSHYLPKTESMSQTEKEAHQLAQELAELKSTHDLVIDQRDHLADQETTLQRQLQELRSAKSLLDGKVGELHTEMESLRTDLAFMDDYRFQATHDSLTGVWNRAGIMDLLDGELLRARREGTQVGVLMADIDHFKNVNDVYGHPAGDAVLREVAKRVSASVRLYDYVGRYGGEEFLIVLPGCGTEAARHAERIRAEASCEPISTGQEMITVTLSLGAAVSSDGANNNVDALIRAADAALYRAKRAGRNRVETDSPET